MILNKLVVTPFLPLSAPKELQPTPRLLKQTKKIHSKINQMQRFEGKQKQPFNFDDTVCFTELHKIATKSQKKTKELKQKKSISQFLTIKNIYQNPGQLKQSQENSTFQLSSFRTPDANVKAQEFRNEISWEKTFEKGQFRLTSQSTRKYSMNKQNQDYNKPISQRPLTQEKSIRKKSTFMKSKFPYSFDRLSNTLNTPTFKSCEKANPPNAQSLEKTDGTKQSAKPKKCNSLQYSIIKPDEIKRIALKRREQESQNYVSRKKEYRMIYEEMLQQMKRKEETVKRNAMMRELRLKEEQTQSRSNIHTCYSKRKTLEMRGTQKNQLKPWQVEGQPITNFDI